MKKYYLYFFLLFTLNQLLQAQNPVAFQITSEEGLPSQTIYSAVQDKKGFIWIGTDAGLYRYDGIRYYEYKHPLQKSRSLTGLEKAMDGKIYTYNFNGQIFFIENDSLKLLHAWDKGSVSNICTDKSNNLWVCYKEGVAKLSNKTNTWANFASTIKYPTSNYTNSCFVDNDNVFWCLGPKGLIRIKNDIETCYPLNWHEKKVSGEYQLTFYSQQKFIFSQVDGEIFHLVAGNLKPFYSKNLNPLLKDKKITRVEEDHQNRIWIYTYSGIIIYDIKHDTSELLYEDKAFSCGIQDDENSYWLSTLHDGLLRIPELSNKLWIIKDDANGNTKINKVVCAKSSVFFASVNGKIGELTLNDNSINTFSLATKSDIQSLALAEDKQSIFFGIQSSVYTFKQNKAKIISEKLPPAKDILQIGNSYVIATSKGVFYYSPIENLKIEVLNKKWTRSIAYDKTNSRLYLATNSGIDIYNYQNQHWEYKGTQLDSLQIISLSMSSKNKIHALSFNGNIYELSSVQTALHLTSIDKAIIGYQIKENDDCLFLATNKGLWIYNLQNKKTKLINRLSGLASNTIDGLDIDSEYIWLATSKGIQQLPLHTNNKITSSKIYLKNISVNNSIVNYKKPLNLNYKDELKIELNAVALSSENHFQYAYRLDTINSWIFLPAEINQIELPVLSSGPFNLEIKLVDHLGKDSINSVLINGTVNPPFWQRWWFYLMIGITCILLALIIFKQRVKVIHKKQLKELERINLEHQLKLSQETALRAQMNPHFIFNVLNSIKSYIYDNDKKKAASYLQRFSDLVRKILEQSSMSWVKLDEEIELLKLYIELESMLFIDEFQYSIQINDNIDTSHTALPSLILQPFIENAFKHGLRHKLGEKKLDILFAMDTTNTVLNVTITDNGIGRSQSKIINDSNYKKHQSFSTDAINKVTVLNQNQPGIIAINYLDLYNNNHDSIGTSVVIKIKSND
ncbi:MAG: histidine kinase [Bacteroidia bacterium]|nr:histidine kinase [Bacteroidia bacterium]